MSQQTINVGASPNDGTGTPLRTAFQYTNSNFSELYTALGGGSGLPGATTQVIFNDGGTNLAGDAGLVYNKTTDALTIGGNVQAASATITGAATAASLTVTGSTIPTNGVYLASANNLTFAFNSTLGMSLNAGGLLVNNTSGFNTVANIKLKVGGRFLSGISGIGAYSFGTADAGGFVINDAGDGSTENRLLTLNSTGLGVGRNPSYRFQASSGTKATTASIATVSGITTTDSDDFGIFFRLKTDATGANRYAAITSFDNGSGNGPRDLVLQDLGGNVGIGVTPSAGAGCLQLVSGVNFPATQVASANANTLDDYEEGTWTPTIIGSTTAGTGTYTSQVGRYTKIGNIVTVQIYLYWTAHTGTGGMQISGLPFNLANISGLYGSPSFGLNENISLTAGYYLGGYANINSDRIILLQYPVGGGSVLGVPVDATGELSVSLTYRVS